MEQKQFNQIVNSRLKHCKDTLITKAAEYANGSDRLHNFKIAQKMYGKEVSQMQALKGMK